jgi:hypothetical protein
MLRHSLDHHHIGQRFDHLGRRPAPFGPHQQALPAVFVDQMAVSSLKCNVVEGSMPVFHEVEVGQEDLCWALPA